MYVAVSNCSMAIPGHRFSNSVFISETISKNDQRRDLHDMLVCVEVCLNLDVASICLSISNFQIFNVIRSFSLLYWLALSSYSHIVAYWIYCLVYRCLNGSISEMLLFLRTHYIRTKSNMESRSYELIVDRYVYIFREEIDLRLWSFLRNARPVLNCSTMMSHLPLLSSCTGIF